MTDILVTSGTPEAGRTYPYELRFIPPGATEPFVWKCANSEALAQLIIHVYDSYPAGECPPLEPWRVDRDPEVLLSTAEIEELGFGLQ
jgi:hypothetical protein